MKVLRLVILVLLAAVVAASTVTWWWLHRPLPLVGAPVELSIEPGSSPRAVADAWVKAGIRTQPFVLYEWFRWSGKSRRIRAGSYEVTAGTTPMGLLEKMVRGDESLSVIRIGEGWTFRQVRAELARADSLKPVSATMSDPELMQAIGAPGESPEGRFHPDTYSYSKGSTDLAVLKRAHRAMRRRLAAAWEERARDTPLKNADEALTLASIIEKESGLGADRRLVAGVFINRLRIGMRLQTDPTVIYGLGESFDGNLRKRDLLADTPYNTYTRAGLPPTPIALPSNAALLATVRPEQTKALYFVARGDGSSEFSETLSQHNRAVNRFQRQLGKP